LRTILPLLPTGAIWSGMERVAAPGTPFESITQFWWYAFRASRMITDRRNYPGNVICPFPLSLYRYRESVCPESDDVYAGRHSAMQCQDRLLNQLILHSLLLQADAVAEAVVAKVVVECLFV